MCHLSDSVIIENLIHICARRQVRTYTYCNRMVVFQVESNMMCVQRSNGFASRQDVSKYEDVRILSADRRFELKQISMHVLRSATMSLACLSRNVA